MMNLWEYLWLIPSSKAYLKGNKSASKPLKWVIMSNIPAKNIKRHLETVEEMSDMSGSVNHKPQEEITHEDVAFPNEEEYQKGFAHASSSGLPQEDHKVVNLVSANPSAVENSQEEALVIPSAQEGCAEAGTNNIFES